jgi:hypothetical protein
MKLLIVAFFVLLITGCAQQKTPLEKCRDSVEEQEQECVIGWSLVPNLLRMCTVHATSQKMACERRYGE